jgi:hypothetical protein
MLYEHIELSVWRVSPTSNLPEYYLNKQMNGLNPQKSV